LTLLQTLPGPEFNYAVISAHKSMGSHLMFLFNP